VSETAQSGSAPNAEPLDAADVSQDGVTGAPLGDPVEPAAERSSRAVWTIGALVLMCAAIIGAIAFGAGWRLPRLATARAAVVATATVPAAPTIGALMSAPDPSLQIDRLGAFTAETTDSGSSDQQGPAGADGADGPEGPAGADGAPGADGSVGATGPAGIGLTVSEEPTPSVSIVSPDGTSYRIVVTNDGIYLQGPTTTQVWSDTSHFQIPVQ
jgi:hypothetical protein